MTADTIRALIAQLATDPPSRPRESARQLEALGEPAIPALTEALAHENRFVRRTAARVLGRLHAVEAVPQLIATMADDYARARRAALGALINIGSDSVPALRDACSCDSPRIQRLALTALRRLEAWDSIDVARTALDDEDGNVRREAGKLLILSGDANAFDAAVDCLTDEDVAETVAHELAQLGERGRDVLLDATQGEDRVARRAAAVALAKSGEPNALSSLLDSYADGEIPMNWEAPGFIESAAAEGHEVPFEQLIAQARGEGIDLSEPWAFHQQRPAVEALGRIADPRAVPVLSELSASEHAILARLAADGLGRIGDADCIPPLTEALGHDHQSVRRQAALALVGLRQVAHDTVLALLESDSRAQRDNAAHVLSEWGAPALGGMLAAVESDNPHARQAALFALCVTVGKHPDLATEDMGAAAGRAMGDDVPSVRRWAMDLAGGLGDVAPIATLVDHLTDPDRQARRKARRAVAKLGEAVLPELSARVSACEEIWPGQMLGKALGALGEVGVQCALPLVDHPNPTARYIAGCALAESGSSDAMPGLLKLAQENDPDIAATAMWGLSTQFTDEAASALESMAANEALSRKFRRWASRAARAVRERLRMVEEEPPDNGKG
ncbi:MAG TPA: HEAT repeat domain-containing protein [Armatimonadota bacterium]|nr:HEAT repeat domain-containing protein [Armatimonadota bacterium]